MNGRRAGAGVGAPPLAERPFLDVTPSTVIDASALVLPPALVEVLVLIEVAAGTVGTGLVITGIDLAARVGIDLGDGEREAEERGGAESIPGPDITAALDSSTDVDDAEA